jgi:lipid-A-disaccharide synthase
MPGMLSIVEDFPDYQFVIAGAPQEFSFYESFITNAILNSFLIKPMIY